MPNIKTCEFCRYLLKPEHGGIFWKCKKRSYESNSWPLYGQLPYDCAKWKQASIDRIKQNFEIYESIKDHFNKFKLTKYLK